MNDAEIYEMHRRLLENQIIIFRFLIDENRDGCPDVVVRMWESRLAEMEMCFEKVKSMRG